jgi:pSer/pThr/pTyr-binding forkhead associated (FHA) protein
VYLVVPPGGSFPETRRIELGPGALTIGRAEACGIRVDVPGVDEEHAKISEIALVALGPDCAIGDVPLDVGSRRLVMPGDEIQIGSVVVALEGDDPSLASADSNSTQRLGNPYLEGPRVRVVEGSNFGDELLLEEENHEYTIGRGPTCDLVIEDREVSREHLKLVRRGYNVFLKDLSSTRGSWLGRSAVYTGATVEWARPRMLRVGATVLSLELPEAIRRAASGPQASAPMTPTPFGRDRNPAGMQATASSPAVSPAPSQPPPRNEAAGGASAADASTRNLQPFTYDSAPQAPEPVGMSVPTSAASTPRGLPNWSPSRKAWKKTGPTIGKASGFLLLALAGLAILGALFVVFTLLE